MIVWTEGHRLLNGALLIFNAIGLKLAEIAESNGSWFQAGSKVISRTGLLDQFLVEFVAHEFKEERSMLVLSRKLNEVIVIGDSIEIKVLKISGNSVRLGIAAAPDIRIERSEIRGQLHHFNSLSEHELCVHGCCESR